MKKYHAVIVGAGISGLSAAFFLSQRASREHLPLKITVLEASNRFGGVLRTLTCEDLQVEAGADAFYAGRNDATDLCRELGLEEDLTEAAPCFRHFFYLKDKKFFSIHGLPGSFFEALCFLSSPRLNFFTKCQMLGEPFIPSRREGGDESLASFIRRRLGEGFYREVVKPLAQSVYMMDAERLSLEALFPGLRQAERTYGSLTGSFLSKINGKKEKKTAEYLTLKHGLEGLIQALVRELKDCKDWPSRPRERAGIVGIPACKDWPSRPRERAGIVGIPACDLRRSAPVRQCVYNAGWEISMEDGAVLRADLLGLAMNACDSSKLLSTAAPELSRELSEIRYDSIVTVNLIYKSEDVPACEDWPSRPCERAGSVGIPARGMGPGFLVPMAGEQYPFSSLKWLGKSADGKHLSLRAFLSETMLPGFFRESDEVLKQKIMIFLSDFFGVQAQPLFIDVQRYPGALPQYDVGHLGRVAGIEKKALQYPGLFFAGNGFRGFGITDCVRQARIAASSLQFPV